MRVVFGDQLPGETPLDTSHLLVQGVDSRAKLNVAEGRNILKVLLKYFGRTPIAEVARLDYSGLLDLHREMFGEVRGWAGRPRTEELNIGVSWTQIQERLYNLLEDLRAWDESKMDPIELATRLHHGTVLIHPFPNGNGRWGRMVTNIWLALRGMPIIDWPERLLGTDSPARNDYIAALNAADQGDFEPLIAMHRNYLSRS